MVKKHTTKTSCYGYSTIPFAYTQRIRYESCKVDDKNDLKIGKLKLVFHFNICVCVWKAKTSVRECVCVVIRKTFKLNKLKKRFAAATVAIVVAVVVESNHSSNVNVDSRVVKSVKNEEQKMSVCNICKEDEERK